MTTLEEARSTIDRVDKELVRLMEERMAAVVDVAAYKKAHNLPVLDEGREAAVLEKVKGLAQNPDFKEYIVMIFKDMMDVTKEYQRAVIGEDACGCGSGVQP